ncbi:hypothetical protein TNCV_2511121 [Trichonephila clavipes]|nr:hypothetical protein TNCV_2511121 [Trichonephila clavipes]
MNARTYHKYNTQRADVGVKPSFSGLSTSPLLFMPEVQWLVTLTAVPLVLGSNPGEDMDICKCIVPSPHGGTLNSHRAASPLVRLVEEEER